MRGNGKFRLEQMEGTAALTLFDEVRLLNGVAGESVAQAWVVGPSGCPGVGEVAGVDPAPVGVPEKPPAGSGRGERKRMWALPNTNRRSAPCLSGGGLTTNLRHGYPSKGLAGVSGLSGDVHDSIDYRYCPQP